MLFLEAQVADLFFLGPNAQGAMFPLDHPRQILAEYIIQHFDEKQKSVRDEIIYLFVDPNEHA